MFRKIIIAAATLAALTGLSMTPAAARGHGGHGGPGAHFAGGHWGGGHWGGGHWGGGGFYHRRAFGPRFGVYGYYPYASYYGGCYRWRRVPTPWGWRTRRVWVCG
jgi:hypothetical protein